MAKYATLADVTDPALSNLEESHLLRADVMVDAALRERGIDPAEVTLPKDVLTELAVNHACRIAAIGDDSPLIPKAREYEKSAALLTQSLSRKALGLTEAAEVVSLAFDPSGRIF